MRDEFTDVELLIAALREPSREVARLYLAGQALAGLCMRGTSCAQDADDAVEAADACLARLYPE